MTLPPYLIGLSHTQWFSAVCEEIVASLSVQLFGPFFLILKVLLLKDLLKFSELAVNELLV